jgi:hypothetical protein
MDSNHVYECRDNSFVWWFLIENILIYYFIHFKKITFYINTLKLTKKSKKNNLKKNKNIKIYKNTVYAIKTNSS